MSTPDHARKTPLYDIHVARGARMVEFAGWLMPVQYRGIMAEHAAVREGAGLFDVSHMGEILVRGPEAVAAVQRLITNDLDRISDGQAQYTVMCRPGGGIVDDLIAYRLDPEQVLLVVNAANREKDLAWVREVCGSLAEVTDESDAWALLALQGPRSPQVLTAAGGPDLKAMAPFSHAEAEVAGAPVRVARTGYTGELGCELFVPAAESPAVMAALLEAGAEPAGLGARDTLRLEMGYALYGNDITEETHPLEARLGWVVKLDKGEFVGREALAAAREQGNTRRLVGLRGEGQGVPRAGYPVLAGERPVGEVTSGTFSPSLRRPIALAYVAAGHAAPGTGLAIAIRQRRLAVEVVRPPFYRRDAA